MTARAVAVLLLALAGAGCTSPQPCPTPLEECGGTCIDVQTDPHHCGACDRACPGGAVCRGASCAVASTVACSARSGGSFVTVAACGEIVKSWVSRATFVAGARAQRDAAADPAFVPTLAPTFTALPHADCDAQWSWHVDEADPAFLTTAELATLDPAGACSVCPSALQGAFASGAQGAQRWCPRDARVLAVDP